MLSQRVVYRGIQQSSHLFTDLPETFAAPNRTRLSLNKASRNKAARLDQLSFRGRQTMNIIRVYRSKSCHFLLDSQKMDFRFQWRDSR